MPRSNDPEALKRRVSEGKKSAGEIIQSVEVSQIMASAIQSCMSAIAVSNREGFLLYVNPALLDMWGYEERTEILGKSVVELWHITNGADEIVKTLGETGQWTGELTAERKDGTCAPVMVNASVMTDDKDTPIGIVFSFVDMSDRKRREAQLARGEEKYRSLVESALDLIFTVDRNGYFTYVNPEFEKITGFSLDDLKGRPFTHVVAPGQREATVSRFKKGIRGTAVPPYEVDLTLKNGTTMPVEFLVTTLFDTKGQPTGRYGIGRDITARIEMERDLRESEQRLTAVIQGSPIPIFVIEREHRTIFWNRALEEMSGISAGEVIGTKNHWRAFYKNYRPCMADLLIDERFDEIPPWYAGKYKKSDLIEDSFEATDFFPEMGKWLRFTATALRDSEGKIIGVLETLEDISERILAEEALKQAEEKYRSIYENAVEGIYQSTLDGKFISANPALARIFGYDSPEDMMSAINNINHQIYVTPHDRVRFIEHLDKNDALGCFEYQVYQKDGTVIWISDNARSVRDDQGHLLYFEGTLQDITDRKKAEAALRQSEERYRRFFEEDLSGAYVSKTDGTLVACNPAFVRMFGFSSIEEAMNTDTRSLYRKVSDRTAFLERLALHRKMENYESEMRRVDGTLIHTIENVVGIFDDRDNLVELKGYLIDVTEQRELESQLHHAQKMEAIGTLAGGIAHDFNNLLMGIQGNTSLMLLNTEYSHHHYGRLKHIEEYVSRGADLTKQLLGFARGGKYEVRPTDLNELVRKSSQMFSRTKKEITIHRKLQEDIWTVDADRGQIDQVLLNLYVNAWQAMPGGGDLYLQTDNITLTEDFVRPYSREPGRYVKVSVTDTGVGMDEMTQKRIFEPFFTTKEMGRGTGLGLAAAYGIIISHNGIIRVESEKGHGTSVTLYLPSSEKKIIGDKTLLDHIIKGTGTVLLVDDEEMIVDIGTELLKMLGYHTIKAKSGIEAIEKYRHHKNEIDLVILDMIMPGMGGGETYDRLKEMNSDVKVMLSSGYSIDGKAQEILKRGCQSFIQKPYNIGILSKKITEILGTS